MRMFAQDAAFYRRVRVDETNNAEALRRLKELEAVDRMRERFTLAESLSALGVGRSTYYERKRRLREEGVRGLIPRSSRPKSHPGRQWTMTDAKRVLDARRKMPWAGEGADRVGAGRAVAGTRAERGDDGSHPAVGGVVRAGEAVLVLRRAVRREAAARLHRRACAPVEAARQARRRAVRPHDHAR